MGNKEPEDLEMSDIYSVWINKIQHQKYTIPAIKILQQFEKLIRDDECEKVKKEFHLGVKDENKNKMHLKITDERLSKLKRLLNEYEVLYEDSKERVDKKGTEIVWGRADKLILRAFKLEKPLSLIEIYEKDYERVMDFVKGLSEFLFVSYYNNGDINLFSGGIFVSRFKSLLIITSKFKRLSDTFADLAGVLFGYSLEEIWEYCVKRRKYNLIK